MPLQDCGDNGKKWGEQGKCYTGPEAARKAYAQGMAMGEVGKSEFEALWGPFTKADLTSAVEAVAIAKYNENHDDNGKFSSLGHVPDANGHRFTLGDPVRHVDTGRIGLVTETHPDKRGKNHEASVLFGDREGIFRSNVHQAMNAKRFPAVKLEKLSGAREKKVAAELVQLRKDWAQFDAERQPQGGGVSRGSGVAQAASGARQAGGGGLLNKVAATLAEAGHAISSGNRSGFMLSGGGGGGGGTLSTKGGGRGGGKGRGAGKGRAAGKGGARRGAATGKGFGRTGQHVGSTAGSKVTNPGKVSGVDFSKVNFGSFKGMTVGQAATKVAQQAGLDPNSDAAEPALVAVLRAYGIDETKFPTLGPSGPSMVLKDEDGGGGDNPESVKVSFRGKEAKTAIAAAHNTLHHAGIDSDLHRGPFSGPHLHVGPQSQQSGPLTYGSIGSGVAQDIEQGVAPARALTKALYAAGIVRDPNRAGDDVDQAVIDSFAEQVRAGADPAETAQQVISSLQNQGGAAGGQQMMKQEPSSSDVHVNAVAGAINPGKMHKFVDDGTGKCATCGGTKAMGIHKGEQTAFDIEFPIWIDKAEERYVSYGVALHPELRDSQGDRVTKEDIEDAAHRFMVMYRETGVQHVGDALPTVQVVESYLAPQEMKFVDNRGREHLVLKGSWVLGHKINDPVLWERVKKGVDDPDAEDALSGLSIQGTGIRLAE